MALSDTEIIFIAVACCGVLLLIIFIIIFIVCCVMERKRKKRMVRREPSFKSGQARAKFMDYERRVFKPPPTSTGSSSYKRRIDDRSETSGSSYSAPGKRRKLPPVGYDVNYDERSFGFDPYFEKGIMYNRRSLVLTDNTIYIPYTPSATDMFVSERRYSDYRIPRLSIRELEDDVSVESDRKFTPKYSKQGLPPYELDYM